MKLKQKKCVVLEWEGRREDSEKGRKRRFHILWFHFPSYIQQQQQHLKLTPQQPHGNSVVVMDGVPEHC